jgi:hypothetical protein
MGGKAAIEVRVGELVTVSVVNTLACPYMYIAAAFPAQQTPESKHRFL